MTETASCPSQDRLEKFSKGELSATTTGRLREHVIHCAACASVLESFKFETLSIAVDVVPPGEHTNLEQTPCPSLPTLAMEAFKYLRPPAHPGEIGQLGPYRILKVLGEGGMGLVFQARDPMLDRLVALKVMKPDGATEVSRQRFLQEGRVAAQLQHDHIVTIFQVGEDRDVPFLAMQYLEGEPLDRRLKRDGKLPIREVIRIGREVAEGLAAAHGRSLIHRDIKPANIWLETQPSGVSRVKILDFGLARAINDNATHLTRTGVIMGTPDYMAPEQARGQTLDPRCDLFSLGCVMYHMATGRKPFQGEDVMATLLALATEEPTSMRQLNPDVPWELEDRVKALMAKNAGDRPASALAVVEELKHLDENLDTLSKRPAPGGRPMAPPVAPGGMPRPPARKRRTVNPAAVSVDDVLRAPVSTPPTKPGKQAPPAGSGTVPLPADEISDAPTIAKPLPPAKSEAPTAPRPVPPTRAPMSAPAPKAEPCPRCGSNRFKPGPTGWCSACGYAPGLPLHVQNEVVDDIRAKHRREASLGWLHLMYGGAIALVIGTYAATFFFPRNSFSFTIWAWFQMTAGLGSFLFSLVWTYLLCYQYRDTSDGWLPLFMSPSILLRLSWQLHSRTRSAICLGVWGLVMAIAIFVAVGSLKFWLTGGKF